LIDSLRYIARVIASILTADSIPVTLTFEQATGKNVLLLPMGSSTDAAHSINEKLDKRNYIQGTKLLGAYLHYVAEEPIAA
jgi:Cys-Gly metallodipeptidase DUG1